MNSQSLQTKWHGQEISDVFSHLETSAYGLSHDEATRRREQFGDNTIPEAKRQSLVVIFFKQFKNLLVLILLIAAGLSLYFDHLFDAIVIVVVIVINAIFGFVQEYKSEKAIAALKKLVKDTAKVVRDGQLHETEIANLVPGDVLFVENGDKIPADGRVIEQSNLLTNEASLTGESVPQHKTTAALSEQAALPERKNMVFSGTVAVSGEGRVVVTATGQHTFLGKIAADVQEAGNQPSTFMIKVNRLGHQLGFLAIGAAAILMGIGFWRGFEQFEVLLLGVATAVSAIPEGLPVVLAVVLAIGVQRMARKNAIVKHLASVEPLGMAQVICTDKTGTLTRNIMTATRLFVGGDAFSVTGTGYELEGDFWLDETKVQPLRNQYLTDLLTVGALTNRAVVDKTADKESPEVIGDPTEIALVVAAAKAGLHKHDLTVEYKTIDTLPFTSEYKYQALLVDQVQNKKITRQLFSIGAFESVIMQCTTVVWEDAIVELTDEIKKMLTEQMHAYARDGFRVIAAAYNPESALSDDVTHDDVSSLTFLGLFGIIDPPRDEVKSAIAQCKSAGIRLVMVTGDNKDTAVAIAREVGLLEKHDDGSQDVYTDKDVANLSDTEFAQIAKSVKILARVSPATKLRLVKTIRSQNNIVAMTGDGVNDAPALKAADIGVAMGKVGTDVARESAEIVLSDDNFASLVQAVKEGRVVFNNVRKTTGYLVTTNVAELVTLIIALVIGLPMPLLPIHVLLLNLVTDGIPVISLATEPDHGDVLKRPPFKTKTNIIDKEVVHLMVINAVLMAIGTIAIGYTFLQSNDIEYGRTIVFTTMSLFQAWNIFNMRSMNKSIISLRWLSNKYVNMAFLFSVGFAIVAMYVPFLAKIFSFKPLSLDHWAIIVPVTFTIIIAVEIYKYIRFKEKRFM